MKSIFKFPTLCLTGLSTILSLTVSGQSFVGGTGMGMAICSDSTLVIWGNSESYCGSDSGSIVHSTVPVAVSGISGVASVETGSSHIIALKGDGTVWGWGENVSGSVGDGSYIYRSAPVQVVGVSGITKIISGWDHSFALKSDNTVWSWGINNYGQLGNGGVGGDQPAPVQIPLLTGAFSIGAGENHSIAVRNDSLVLAWGSNSEGQLGDGTNSDHNIPMPVTGLTGVKQVSCGRNHSVALRSDGTVWCWGSNSLGQLGVPIDTLSPYPQELTPVQISGGHSDFISVSAGDDFTIGLKSDGTVWSWGNNNLGQLGTSLFPYNTDAAIQVTSLSGIVAISAGYAHSYALKNDGTMWAWGWNALGQLGNGVASTGACECEKTPLQVNSLCPVLSGIATKSKEAEISVYPNPAVDFLWIDSKEKIKSFGLMNALGQRISLRVENNKVDVSGFAKGIYFLMIQMENDQVVKKFVKE